MERRLATHEGLQLEYSAFLEKTLVNKHRTESIDPRHVSQARSQDSHRQTDHVALPIESTESNALSIGGKDDLDIRIVHTTETAIYRATINRIIIPRDDFNAKDHLLQTPGVDTLSWVHRRFADWNEAIHKLR